MRVFSALAVLAAAACLSLGCHLISGVGDLQFVDTGGSGGSGGHGHTTSTSSSDLGGGGHGGSTGGAGTCLADLQDGFDGAALDTGLWTESVSSVTTGVTGGHYFVQVPGQTASAWGDIMSVATYDLQGCSVMIELVKALKDDGDATTVFSILTGSWQDSSGFQITGGEFRCRVVVAGTETAAQAIPYVAADHRWLRLREDSGTLFFETSLDALTWSIRYETASPAYVSQASIYMGAGSWTGTATHPGEAQFDNVDLPP